MKTFANNIRFAFVAAIATVSASLSWQKSCFTMVDAFRVGFLTIPRVSNTQAQIQQNWWTPSCTENMIPRRRSDVIIPKMGIMEDFMTGQDSSTRTKENVQYLEQLQKRIERINDLESTIEELDDEELAAKTIEFKKRIQNNGEDIMNGPLLEEVFAVVREAAWRVLELRHYDVQLLGGMILHDGRLAEMATGEGKTLVSTLPIYLNALTGNTSFVVTVNDYLARRDMEKMGQVYKFLGLRVGLIQSSIKDPDQRRAAYTSDVVYVTNSELGFDYLRDHLALSTEQTVLLRRNKNNNTVGGLSSSSFLNGCFCVVDEADSVLIDEARTPLIISEQVPAPANKYGVANELANALKKDIHYKVDLKNKNIVVTDIGYSDSERALGVSSLFELVSGDAWAPYVMNAIKAKELFTRDVDYTVLNDASTSTPIGVGIIDAFTGRVLDGRRWSDGLHQSIEAREGIAVSKQSKVIAKVTYQALFRQLFGQRLSGMTGTAMADATEFELVYNLKVTPVPTALPVARRDYPDVAFRTRKAANDALIKEIINVGGGTKTGRPCLVGTTSVAQSEVLVDALASKGIKAELLNASPKNAPRESEIIAQAGRTGVVTVATNMAGRGTDILLGGCSRTMSRIKTRSVLLDLGVITSNDPTTTIFPPSPPDEYFPCPVDDETYEMLTEAAKAIKDFMAADNTEKKLSQIDLDEVLTIAFDTTEAEDDPVHIIKLRNAADAVKELYESVLSSEKDNVKKLGGLYVMGTNRHESSRIDQQLRGRAGRQGDPGSSRFFVSFEDDMFVIFGGDKLQGILKSFRVSDDMPIEAPQITAALDKVQKEVEQKYRTIRDEIFRFDEVLNQQRNVIYSRRTKILFSTPDETIQLFRSYNDDTVNEIVTAATIGDVTDVTKVIQKIVQFFPLVGPFITEDDLRNKDVDTVTTFFRVAVDEAFNNEIMEAQSKNKKTLGRTCNYITLVTMDNAWSDHLQALENLKETVVLRSYQGRDPISEYEKDSFDLFQGLVDTMRRNAVYSLWQNLLQQQQSQQIQQQKAIAR